MREFYFKDKKTNVAYQGVCQATTSGIGWDELTQRIKACDMPTSKVHIVIER